MYRLKQHIPVKIGKNSFTVYRINTLAFQSFSEKIICEFCVGSINSFGDATELEENKMSILLESLLEDVMEE